MSPDNDVALEHYGVKGMKWGVRREAKRDANKFAKAKMYYGEGAGTQRKLIKATVESKRKKDSQYGEAFDYYMDNTVAKKVATEYNVMKIKQQFKNFV